MNKQQREYTAAKKALEKAEAALKAEEKVFMQRKGRTEARMEDIEDDRAFDCLLMEFYEEPEIVALAEVVEAKRDELRAAENSLIEFALSIAPAGIRETLRKGASTQITIRQKLIETTMKLDTRTVRI